MIKWLEWYLLFRFISRCNWRWTNQRIRLKWEQKWKRALLSLVAINFHYFSTEKNVSKEGKQKQKQKQQLKTQLIDSSPKRKRKLSLTTEKLNDEKNLQTKQNKSVPKKRKSTNMDLKRICVATTLLVFLTGLSESASSYSGYSDIADRDRLVPLVPQQSCYYESYSKRLACVCKSMDMAASLDLKLAYFTYRSGNEIRFLILNNL